MRQNQVISLFGVSNQEYVFKLYSLEIKDLKGIGGVYAFSRYNSMQETHEIVYIGISEDFSDRFVDHHKARCIKRESSTHFWILVEHIESTRKLIENDLIPYYNPPCNDQLTR